jgi:ATP/maltotriose-dependent transcriptional regulator MalT
MSVLAWLDALPADVTRQRPQLALLHANALLATGRTEEAEPLVEAAEHALASDERATSGEGQSDRQRLRGEALAARAALLFSCDDYLAASDTYQRALEHIPETATTLRATVTGGLGVLMATSGQLGAAAEAQRAAYVAYQASGDLVGMLESRWILGTLLLSMGELPAAARALRGAIDLATSGARGPLPAASGAYHYLGRIFYEWDRRAEAATLVETSQQLNVRNGDAGLEVRTLLLLGRLRHAASDDAGVRACIQRVDQIQRAPGVRRGVTELAGAVSARLALAMGDLDAAGAWAREAGLAVEARLSRQEEFAHLTFARLLLAEGRLDEATYFLDRLAAAAAPTERADMQIEIGLLRALALDARKERAGALTALRSALAQAEPGGYVRLMLDEGAPMIALLTHLARERPDRARKPAARTTTVSSAYLATLLRAAHSVATNGPDARGAPDPQARAHPASPLSPREVEIVRRLATGMSNVEIAQDLMVEQSTVKWHIHNLLEKLGVRNRTAALARAHDLGVL